LGTEAMQSFKDKSNLNWDIKFSVYLRRTIRSRVGLDVLKLLAQETLKQLDDEPELVIDMIWACLESQAQGRNIDIETLFSDSHIDEELLETITDLLFDEAIEYAPEKKRATMRKILSIYRKTGKQTMNTLMKHIESIDEGSAVSEITSEIVNSLQLKSTNGKTNSEANSELSPTVDHSVS
jgi:hypothetical protein